jgi:hypothetical protein
MTVAIFLLTLSFAYILLGTCAQFVIGILTIGPWLNSTCQYFPLTITIEVIFICIFFLRYVIDTASCLHRHPQSMD